MNLFFDQNKIIASVILISALLFLRWSLIRILKKKNTKDEDRLKQWSNSLTNATQFLIVISLIIVWMSELRYAALSVATFVIAIVIATKEYLQNILGTLYLATARPFHIGDWVSIDGKTGEVLRSDWIATTILEVDFAAKSYSHTGNTITIPNNQLLAKAIINLNFMRRFINHSFEIVRESIEGDLFEAKALVLEKAQEYSVSFNELGERYNSMIETKLAHSIEGPAPAVRIMTSTLGKNIMQVSIFCPTEQAIHIEQKITEDFMAFWYEKQKLNCLLKPDTTPDS